MPRRKPRPGRPPRAAGIYTRFELRLTEPERSRWRAFAARQGLDLSSMVRESVETCIARGSTR